MEHLAEANQYSGRYPFRPRILVIDDDESILDLLQDILSSDYSITTASNAQKGQERLGREHFDLVIVDLGLPGMSGMDLIQRLRAEPSYAKLPILVVSAYTELAQRLDGLQVDGVLSKPFSLSELERQVAELVWRGTSSSENREPGRNLAGYSLLS
jgi:two-component system OmpR family response regulator